MSPERTDWIAKFMRLGHWSFDHLPAIKMAAKGVGGVMVVGAVAAFRRWRSRS